MTYFIGENPCFQVKADVICVNVNKKKKTQGIRISVPVVRVKKARRHFDSGAFLEGREGIIEKEASNFESYEFC